MNKRLFFLIVFGCFIAATNAQNFKAINEWVNKELPNLGNKAIVLIYTADKGLVHEYVANGNSNSSNTNRPFLNNNNAINKNSIVRIASCSKWLTAALVMTFVDEGKLNISDTIGKFLPQATTLGKGQITIWQCLSHLTAIEQEGMQASWKTIFSATNMDDCMNKILQLPLEGIPGKTFRYGNSGLQIAAAVIEKIGGNSFENLFQQRIAKPCQMYETSFGKGKVPLAAGGASSTANNYLNFLIMLLQNGEFNGKKILSKQSIAAMQINRLQSNTIIKQSPAEAGNWGYGFGEWVMENYKQSSKNSAVSSPGLFGTFPWLDVEKKYVGLLFTFNITSKGRHARYNTLQQLTEKALGY